MEGRMPDKPRDFRLYLQNELTRRCSHNPKYSLRAFAYSLKIDPSTLSQILRGKRSLTEATKFRLAERLGLSVEETRWFKAKQSQTGDVEFVSPSDNEYPQQLTVDAFQVVADWYHFAILELLKVRNFRSDLRWVAKVLGLTSAEVHVAIERLQRLQILSLDESGFWKTSREEAGQSFSKEFSEAALRRFHQQVLRKAAEALDEVPSTQRTQSVATVAASLDKISEAVERIKKFSHELCEFLEEGSSADEVFQLNIALYPLSRGAGKTH